jgi:predicted PurR-regulated permease PerM
VIPTLILAALVAFIVSPLVRFFNHRLRLKKGLAVAFTYLLVVVILILIPLILLPAIVNAVNSFLTVDFQAAAETVVQAVEQASATLDGVPVLQGVVGPLLDSLLQSLQAISSTETPEPISYSLTVSEAGSTLAEMVGRVAQVVGPVIGAITSVVFMVLISVYFSLSSDQIRSWYPKLVPPGYEPEVAGVFKRIGGLWASYLRGELTLMVLVGTIVWLGNLALGNTNALLLGVISGLMELIPNIGPAIALIPGVLMALLFGSSHLAVSNVVFALIVLAFYLLVQAAENQLIVPHIMGDAVELPPLVVIIGTFVGATTVGILGALLATPVIATGREVFGYLYDKILEPPLTVGPPQEKPSFFEAVTSGMRNLTGRIKLPSRLQVNRLLGRGKRAEGEPLASTVVPEADPNPHADPPAEVTSGTGAASGPTPSPA